MRSIRRQGRGGALAIVGLVAILMACEAIPERGFVGQIAAIDGEGSAVVELKGGEIALLAADMKSKWIYRPRFPPLPDYFHNPTPHLVCRPSYGARGPIVLTFPTEIHVIDRSSGERLWKLGRPSTDVRALPALALGRAFVLARSCPAVTPDSGVVTLRTNTLRKHDAKGVLMWTVDLTPYGGAVDGPHVLWPNGNILIRAKHQIALFSPQGRLNGTMQWR